MSRRTLDLVINGERHQLLIEPHWTLLQVLRTHLGMMGTKENCLEAECGVCTVLLDGKAVNSCILLAGQAEGRAITNAMAQHGRVFRTDTEVRSQPYFHRLCQIVRNGRIGQVRRLVVTVPRSPEPIPGFPAPMPVPADLNYELWQGPAPERPYTQARVHHPRGGLEPA